MYKAIQTTILPPTQTLPTRIKVQAHGVATRTYSKWSFGDTKLHAQAAERFRKDTGWNEGQWMAGEVTPGKQVHVRYV